MVLPQIEKLETVMTQLFNSKEEFQNSFADLNKTLVETPVLGYPDPDGHFILGTNVHMASELCSPRSSMEKRRW